MEKPLFLTTTIINTSPTKVFNLTHTNADMMAPIKACLTVESVLVIPNFPVHDTPCTGTHR